MVRIVFILTKGSAEAVNKKLVEEICEPHTCFAHLHLGTELENDISIQYERDRVIAHVNASSVAGAMRLRYRLHGKRIPIGNFVSGYMTIDQLTEDMIENKRCSDNSSFSSSPLTGFWSRKCDPSIFTLSDQLQTEGPISVKCIQTFYESICRIVVGDGIRIMDTDMTNEEYRQHLHAFYGLRLATQEYGHIPIMLVDFGLFDRQRKRQPSHPSFSPRRNPMPGRLRRSHPAPSSVWNPARVPPFFTNLKSGVHRIVIWSISNKNNQKMTFFNGDPAGIPNLNIAQKQHLSSLHSDRKALRNLLFRNRIAIFRSRRDGSVEVLLRGGFQRLGEPSPDWWTPVLSDASYTNLQYAVNLMNHTVASWQSMHEKLQSLCNDSPADSCSFCLMDARQSLLPV